MLLWLLSAERPKEMAWREGKRSKNYFRFGVVAMCDRLKKIPLANISIDHVKMKPKLQITAPGQTVEVFSFLEGFHIAFIRNNG